MDYSFIITTESVACNYFKSRLHGRAANGVCDQPGLHGRTANEFCNQSFQRGAKYALHLLKKICVRHPKSWGEPYNLVIRRAVVSDAPHIYTILQTAFKEYAEASGITTELEALRETIFDIEHEISNKVVYIAVIDKLIVGTIRVEVFGNEAYISRFAVNSPHRNNGVGKSLMNHVDNYLKSKGVQKAFLYTASRYGKLMRFYYGQGFYVESISNDRGYPRAKMVKHSFPISASQEE